MPLNRLALIRYKTIDACLRNRTKKWTLEKLIDACSDAIYEFEGIDNGISKRTVQLDLQMMRSDKLGYNAPIIVIDKKFYTYEDDKYSITNIPLTKQDLTVLTEVKDILRQFKGFSHFEELGDMINRLEDKIYTSRSQQPSLIQFETNDRLRGLEHLDIVHRAIMMKKPLRITYRSFKARSANEFIFHPYLLKEYRNRWFVLGKRKADLPTLILALDRIEKVDIAELNDFLENRFFSIQNYFHDIIGVTKSEQGVVHDVVFKLNREHSPYNITKPMHPSQTILEQHQDGSVTFQVKVQHNYELERELISFGENVEVIAPRFLKQRIKKRLKMALEVYDDGDEGLNV